MRLLVTRPKDMANSLAAALSSRGHRVRMEPLLKIDPIPFHGPIPPNVQAVVLTSPRGARFGATRSLLDFPAYAIGATTARTAKNHGWTHVINADGDGAAVAAKVAEDLAPEDGAILHLRGETARDVAPKKLEQLGFTVRSQVVYRARPVENFTTATIHSLERGDTEGVILFSPATASTYDEIVKDLELVDTCRDMSVFCLSDAVADPVAGLPWKHTFVANAPNSQAMLDLIDAVVQES